MVNQIIDIPCLLDQIKQSDYDHGDKHDKFYSKHKDVKYGFKHKRITKFNFSQKYHDTTLYHIQFNH